MNLAVELLFHRKGLQRKRQRVQALMSEQQSSCRQTAVDEDSLQLNLQRMKGMMKYLNSKSSAGVNTMKTHTPQRSSHSVSRCSPTAQLYFSTDTHTERVLRSLLHIVNNERQQKGSNRYLAAPYLPQISFHTQNVKCLLSANMYACTGLQRDCVSQQLHIQQYLQ